MCLKIKSRYSNTYLSLICAAIWFASGLIFFATCFIVFLYFSIFEILGKNVVKFEGDYLRFSGKSIGVSSIQDVELTKAFIARLRIKLLNGQGYTVADSWSYRVRDLTKLKSLLDRKIEKS